eukprot:827278-Rhodomonas_salina.6
MSGTDIAYGARRRSSRGRKRQRSQSKGARCPIPLLYGAVSARDARYSRSVWCAPGTDIAYASAIGVLTKRMVILRACYAMSGTDRA